MILTKAEFARCAGVGKTAISMAIKRGTIPTTPGGDIDTDNIVVKEYMKRQELRRQGKAQPNKKSKAIKKAPAKKPKPVIEKNSEPDKLTPEQFEKLTNPEKKIDINKMVEKFGHTLIESLARIRNKEVDTRLKLQKEKRERRLLVEIKPIGENVARYMEALNKSILNSPLNYADRVIAIAIELGPTGKGQVVEEIQNYITAAIRSAKEEMLRYIEEAVNE